MADGKAGSNWYDKYTANEQREQGQEAKYLEKVVGECEAAFRNAPGLVWVRISYFDMQIRVDLDLQPHTTLSQEQRHFSHHCLTVKDVLLPSAYYFGLSALASGNTEPDAVDVYAFDAWEVIGKVPVSKGEHQKRDQPPPVVANQENRNVPLAGTARDVDEVISKLSIETDVEQLTAFDFVSDLAKFDAARSAHCSS